VVLIVVSSVLFSPEAGFAAKCKNKFYIISLKDSYAKKKYKVRAFFLYPNPVYSIPKMPKGWRYAFNDKLSNRLIAAAETDKEAVDIGYFKNFVTLIITEYDIREKVDFSMVLICNKPDGTPLILVLETKDCVFSASVLGIARN
jgi:hypothetical protein